MIKSYKVQGDIKAYGLTDWWLNDLTEYEREMFRREFKLLSVCIGGKSEYIVDEGKRSKTFSRGGTLDTSIRRTYKKVDSKAEFLGSMLGSIDMMKYKGEMKYDFYNEIDQYELKLKVINEAMKYTDTLDVIQLHYFYHKIINFYWKYRKVSEKNLDKCYEYCLKQVEIVEEVTKRQLEDYPIPEKGYRHIGYQRLVSLYTRDKKYKDTIKLKELHNRMKKQKIWRCNDK